MASRQAMRLRTSAMALALGGAATLYPARTAYAEAPLKDTIPSRRPIYPSRESLNPKLPTLPSTPTTKTQSPTNSSNSDKPPSPTDRLTVHIKSTRLYLYNQTLTLETHLNTLLTALLHQETSLSNTLSSLAPPPQSGETLLPGSIYVLVSTMAGTIVARNRGIFLRTTTPLAFGLVAGWTLIPVTMRNVADLVWEGEKKVPGVAEGHAFVGGFVRGAWKEVVERGEGVGEWAGLRIREGREGVRGWVSDGK